MIRHQFSYWLTVTKQTQSDKTPNDILETLNDASISTPKGPMVFRIENNQLFGEINPGEGTIEKDDSLREKIERIAKDFPEYHFKLEECDEEDHAVHFVTEYAGGRMTKHAGYRTLSPDELDPHTVTEVINFLQEAGYNDAADAVKNKYITPADNSHINRDEEDGYQIDTTETFEVKAEPRGGRGTGQAVIPEEYKDHAIILEKKKEHRAKTSGHILIGEIANIFENYIKDHNITLVNEEREQLIENGEADENELCMIFGDAYDKIANETHWIMHNLNFGKRPQDKDTVDRAIVLLINAFKKVLVMGKYDGYISAGEAGLKADLMDLFADMGLRAWNL